MQQVRIEEIFMVQIWLEVGGTEETSCVVACCLLQHLCRDELRVKKRRGGTFCDPNIRSRLLRLEFGVPRSVVTSDRRKLTTGKTDKNEECTCTFYCPWDVGCGIWVFDELLGLTIDTRQ